MSKMKVCREVFSYTTQSGDDRTDPAEAAMKRLNAEIDAESIISIQEKNEVLEECRFPEWSNRWYCPRRCTLTVFYREEEEDDED